MEDGGGTGGWWRRAGGARVMALASLAESEEKHLLTPSSEPACLSLSLAGGMVAL